MLPRECEVLFLWCSCHTLPFSTFFTTVTKSVVENGGEGDGWSACVTKPLRHRPQREMSFSNPNFAKRPSSLFTSQLRGNAACRDGARRLAEISAPILLFLSSHPTNYVSCDRSNSFLLRFFVMPFDLSVSLESSLTDVKKTLVVLEVNPPSQNLIHFD